MQHKPELYLLFWGNDFWNGTQPFYEGVSLYTEYKGFYEDLAKEQEAPGENSWQGILSQYYGESGSFGNAHVVGEMQETAINAPQNITKENILREITSWVNHGLKQNANTQVIVLAAPGTAYAEDPEKGCGYHGIDEQGYSYSFVAYAGDLNRYFNREKLPYTCNFREGDGEAETTQLMWSSTAVGSHEYAEEVTDPGLNGKYAWYSLSGEEIGDLCNHKPINSIELPAKNGRPGWWYVTELFDDEGGNTCKLEDPPAAPVSPPTVTTEAPTSIQYRQATLNGSVNPNGPEGHYQFEYGTTTGYGSTTSEGAFSYGTKQIGESATVALKVGTKYHYRLRASTWAGTSYGTDKEFTTPIPPPVATTEPATVLGESRATLNATVNPEEAATTYQFEYWPTSKPTEITKLPSTAESVGAGTSNVHVTQRPSTLAPLTEYTYRIAASSAGGATIGKELAFITAPFLASQKAAKPSEAAVLSNVSCISASWCMAGGYQGVPLAESWNGSEWQTMSPPAPTGSKDAGLGYGISCTSSTACTAVGSYLGSSRLGVLVERWNGTSWSIQSTPEPPEKGYYPHYALGDVTCTSATACIAVGADETAALETVPIIESWNGTEWKLVSNPGTKGSLSSISCTSSSACTAVGSTGFGGEAMAERWNGTTWTLQTMPHVEDSGLGGVACKSATSCVAVGSTGGILGTPSAIFSETWNGTSWAVATLPKPLGWSESFLSRVSCISTTSCIAVGYEAHTGERFALADSWNGTQWRTMTVTLPAGAKAGDLSGVSCVSNYCAGVGYDNSSTGEEVPFAAVEGLPGARTNAASGVTATGATLNGVVEPNGRDTSYHIEYGETVAYGSRVPATDAALGSDETPENVSQAITGLNPETTYHYRIVATNASGTSNGVDRTFTTSAIPWVVDSTPSPGTEEDALYQVSCTSTSWCMAVGYQKSSANNVPLAESWNGSEWKAMSPPMPTGGKEVSLASGISCTSSTACTAVGSYLGSSRLEVLVERWNGTSWSIQSTPEPPETGYYPHYALGDVTCTSATACTAVGADETAALETVPIIESWNGTEWKLVSNPGTKGSLSSISCTSSSACTAVGSTGFGGKAMAERWNGTTWTLQTMAEGPGASGVACTTATSCVAVGNSGGLFGSPTEGTSQVWNGTSWSVTSVAKPAGAKETLLHRVSCSSTTSCITVGYQISETGVRSVLAYTWNGSAWTIKTLPLPTGAKESQWHGVSCAGGFCTTAGQYNKEGGNALTLADSN